MGGARGQGQYMTTRRNQLWPSEHVLMHKVILVRSLYRNRYAVRIRVAIHADLPSSNLECQRGRYRDIQDTNSYLRLLCCLVLVEGHGKKRPASSREVRHSHEA